MKRPFPTALVSGCALIAAAPPAHAAISCDLNFPASDVPRMFPSSTSYKSSYFSLLGNDLATVRSRLGEENRAIYEPLEVPYTLYRTYSGDKLVGYVHGVNQKGQYGVIQVFLALDLSGSILSFYIQKITGPNASRLREGRFASQFIGLSLKDFKTYDPVSGKGTGRLARIRNPAPEMETDFYSVLRALNKNLIVMDVVFYSRPGGAS